MAGRFLYSWVVPLDLGASARRLVALFTSTQWASNGEAGGVGPADGAPFQ
jgi:hypothetical protein